MFIVTAKLDRRRLLALGLAAVLVCGACAAGTVLRSRSLAASAPEAAQGERKGVRTNEDRIAYLAEYGWAVEKDPIATEELLLPEGFDDPVYADFLALQTGQGFDPTRYAGKRVKRYSYLITNYPTGEEGVVADLYLYKNTVIGGEVLDPELNGFLHGLAMPEQ